MEIGEKVKFLGCCEAQHNWGSHTGDLSKLKIGKKYKVIKIEVHGWHTKVFIDGIEGSFNSVCFE